MTARIPNQVRRQVLGELALHERTTLKAIGRRYGLSRQTLSRLRAELPLRGLSDKMPLEAKRLHVITNTVGNTVDAAGSAMSTQRMGELELQLLEQTRRIAELQSRVATLERYTVELPPGLIAELDMAAAKRGGSYSRHDFARPAVRHWIKLHPDAFDDSIRH